MPGMKSLKDLLYPMRVELRCKISIMSIALDQEEAHARTTLLTSRNRKIPLALACGSISRNQSIMTWCSPRICIDADHNDRTNFISWKFGRCAIRASSSAHFVGALGWPESSER